MKNKKGIAAQVFIGLILALVAFGIMLIVYSRAFSSSDVDENICEQSVHYKATLPLGKDIIPLNCKTKKYCLTDKLIGGECEEFVGGDYEKVRVSGSLKEKQIQINDFLARRQARCWSMMGKGGLHIFSREFAEVNVKKRCVVCFRIAFDESLKKEISEINGFGNYMITHKVPGKEISYWEYIGSGLDNKGYDKNEDVFSMEEKSVVYMEISKSTAYEWLGGLIGGGGGGLIGAYTGASIGSIVPGVGTFAGGFIGFIGGSFVGGVLGKTGGEEIERELLISELEGNYAAANYFMDYEKLMAEEFDCTIESIA